MKRYLWILMLGLGGCATMDDLFEQEEDVPLSDVPPAVLDAARAVVPGIVLTEAEREKERGVWVYEVEGLLEGQEYEIEVTPEGKVLEVELDD